MARLGTQTSEQIKGPKLDQAKFNEIAGIWAPPKMGSASKIPSASVFPIIKETWLKCPLLNNDSGSPGKIGSSDSPPSIAPVERRKWKN